MPRPVVVSVDDPSVPSVKHMSFEAVKRLVVVLSEDPPGSLVFGAKKVQFLPSAFPNRNVRSSL